jgi:hypothetical protein
MALEWIWSPIAAHPGAIGPNPRRYQVRVVPGLPLNRWRAVAGQMD